jgi:murein DD-endopeptidase MepM/ murein hydrolase activator NlpD
MSIIDIVLSYLGLSLIFGLMIVPVASLYARLDTRTEYWSGFWLSTLVLVALTPGAALLLKLIDWPKFMPVLVDLPTLGPVTNFTQQLNSLTSSDLFPSPDMVTIAKTLMFSLYGVGVLYCGFTLLIGRLNAWRIVSQSEPKTHIDGTPYRLTHYNVSPFTLTAFGRPKKAYIIMPKEFESQLNHVELSDILAHEKAHIARRDDETALLLRSLQIFIWPNILYGLLFSCWKQSAEIQCDQAVLARCTDTERNAYAEMLVKALRILAVRVRQYPTAAFSTQRLRNEKMRINYIMTGTEPIFKKLRHKFMGGSATLLLLLTGSATLPLIANAQSNTAFEALETKAVQSPPQYKAVLKREVDFMVKGHLTSSYGQARDIFNEGKVTYHHGIDIGAPKGTPVHAPATGWIVEATGLYNNQPAYGKVVVLQTDDNTLTVMTHLDSYPVSRGQTVKKGDIIARVGSSGKSTAPHLHVETYKNKKRVDPMTVWPF